MATRAWALASSFCLDSMKSTMSGWSILRMTIFAARRVLPPDLMTPAKASNPFMKLSGPLAVPPPERVSVELRSGERFVPVPLPHLKSMPSVLARVRMESSESFIELIKQAEHCGRVYPVTPNSTCCLVKLQCQLAHAGFALIGASLPVKILRGDYVGRGHGPVFGDLDVFLLKDHASLGVGDLGIAEFPLDLVVGRDTGLGEKTAEG